MRVDDRDSLARLEKQGMDQKAAEIGRRVEALTVAQEGAVVRSDKNLWRKVRKFEN